MINSIDTIDSMSLENIIKNNVHPLMGNLSPIGVRR